MFDRKCDHVIVDECPRCGKESETWEHVWSCGDNEVSEMEVLLSTLIDIEEKYRTIHDEKYKTMRLIAKEIMIFMREDSKILILKKQNKIRELTRGLFNNNLYKLCLTKIDRELIEEIWDTCFVNIRNKIWLV